MSIERHTNENLTLEISDDGGTIRVAWLGRSTAREPGRFILPVLSGVLERSTVENKAIELDFQRLEYLNSSTITPIIRILEKAKNGTNRLTLLYDKKVKWQELNFSALQVFHTGDERVEIRGQ
jgi:hypothetical protein